MASLTAVSVHDNLPAGKAAVSHGTADDKPACGIDKVFGIPICHLPGNHFLYDLFDNRFFQFLISHIRFMLCGNDNCIHTLGSSVFILNGDLGFTVGPEKVQCPVLSDRGKAVAQLVCKYDGHGHQFRGLVRGKAEHKALISCALLFVRCGVYTLGNVR